MKDVRKNVCDTAVSAVLVQCCLVLLLFAGCQMTSTHKARPDGTTTQEQERPIPRTAGPVTPWPRPIPVRVKPEEPDDLFVMTLGPVGPALSEANGPPLADGVFDPQHDRVTLRDGRVIENYYSDVLGIRHFAPIDKTQFPVPPSGWCSWYYYYQDINADEVLANARWAAEHLRDFGFRYVQIDDGWQGVGHGMGENRDWTTIDERFRERSMVGLAAAIRELGLEAGLWLAPHGQSNEHVVRESGAFLLRPDGSSASSTWEGAFLLDPTRPEAHAYLRDLFTRLHAWGYTYFKIDGQPIVLEEFQKKAEFMHATHERARTPSPTQSSVLSPQSSPSTQPSALSPQPAPTSLPAVRVAELYRDTLRSIRDAIGPETYLLGCWGIPLPGVGILNASRTAGDIVQGWDGFLVALDSVMRWNFLHNVAWYCDPDVFMVRPPLTDGVARAWVTLQGLTGQALLTSDRLPDLPASRVEMLKRVYPAVDIRPLDLFPVEDARKPIWVLKVAHDLPAVPAGPRPADTAAQRSGLRPRAAELQSRTPATPDAGTDQPRSTFRRSYDVVGVFNFSEDSTDNFHLSFEALGLEPDAQYHVYDFWQQAYLGAWERGVFVEVPPQDVRVLTLVRAEPGPVLISTSRHITQGWVDLRSLEPSPVAARAPARPTLSGTSRVIANDPYTLTIGLPRAAPTFQLHNVELFDPQSGQALQLPRTFASHQEYATVTIESNETREVGWRLTFAPAQPYVFPVRAPHEIHVRQLDPHRVELTWPPEYHAKAGYQVLLDGQVLGVAFSPRAVLRNLDPGRTIRVGVRSIWYDGSTGTGLAETQFTTSEPQ
jgi:hypothetical protein